MKIAFLLVLLWPALGLCQVSTDLVNQEKSNIENFALKSGSLIKKEFIDLGSVKKVSIQVLKVNDILSQSSVSGIKMTAPISKSYGMEESSCFIDADEVEALVKSGRFLLENLSERATTYTEYQFTSRGGMQAGAFFPIKEKDWSFFLKLEKYDGNSYVFLSRPDFQKIIDILDTAQAQL